MDNVISNGSSALNSGGFLMFKICKKFIMRNSVIENSMALQIGGAFYLFAVE